MAKAGSPIHLVVVASAPTAEVENFLLKSLSGLPEYKVSSDGFGSILLKRRYMPTWAIIVAIAALVIFFVGLLALLVRDNENATIMFSDADSGTRVTVTGTVSEEMRKRLSVCISQLTAQWPPVVQISSSIEVDPVNSVPTLEQLNQLERIVKLRDSGALSSAEFEAAKTRLLGY